MWPSSCVTPAGTSNELDVQNEWEKNTQDVHTQPRYVRRFSPITDSSYFSEEYAGCTKLSYEVSECIFISSTSCTYICFITNIKRRTLHTLSRLHGMAWCIRSKIPPLPFGAFHVILLHCCYTVIYLYFFVILLFTFVFLNPATVPWLDTSTSYWSYWSYSYGTLMLSSRECSRLANKGWTQLSKRKCDQTASSSSSSTRKAQRTGEANWPWVWAMLLLLPQGTAISSSVLSKNTIQYTLYEAPALLIS